MNVDHFEESPLFRQTFNFRKKEDTMNPRKNIGTHDLATWHFMNGYENFQHGNVTTKNNYQLHGMADSL